jgi:hypothetical protein
MCLKMAIGKFSIKKKGKREDRITLGDQRAIRIKLQ